MPLADGRNALIRLVQRGDLDVARPSGTRPATSKQFDAGARNHVAPSRLAPSIFSSMPPILPTLPSLSMVPVPAMVLPPLSLAG